MSGPGAEEDSGERSHEPTQKRLDDARKRGQGPHSADMITAAAYGGLTLTALTVGTSGLVAAAGALIVPLAQADRMAAQVFGGGGGAVLGGAVWAVVLPLLPWFGLPAACALLAIFAQRGTVFAPEKLHLKGSRLSPLAGLKQRLGPSGLVEFGKSFVKLILFAIVLGWLLAGALPRFLMLVGMETGPVLQVILRETVSLLVLVTGLALTIGVADMVWQQVKFRNSNMMTRKDVTDEQKESEGDPHTKGQRRQRGQAIAMNQMLADVPKASVVIVNPTHYAVALSWNPAGGGAPVCVAKGTDAIAARIREIAMEHGIPLHRDAPTARALFATVEIGTEIGRDHYRAVAAAIRFAERLKGKRT
jgi:flagellar biosynthesis protein FlhB